MSVDSQRIEDMYRGTEAEIVDHFSNKNKSIADLQTAVGVVAVSTDTNRIMIFTGPNGGSPTRGDFTWNTFSTARQYTLDDSMIGQYNPLMWFAADKVSDEYLSGGDGNLRDPIQTSDIGTGPPVRNLKLDAANNSGSVVDYGGWHLQQCGEPVWNASPAGHRTHYGIKVDPNKFLRMSSSDMSIWMAATAGSDYQQCNSNNAAGTGWEQLDRHLALAPTLNDRGNLFGTHEIPISASSFGFASNPQQSIITDNGRKYLRTTGSGGTQIGAAHDFTFEFGAPDDPKIMFQVSKCPPGSSEAATSQMIKRVCYYNGGFLTSSAAYKANGLGFGAYEAAPQNGQTYGIYGAGWNGPGGQAQNGYNTYGFDAPTVPVGIEQWFSAWGEYRSTRPLVHDTSDGGGSNISTLTYDWNTLTTERDLNGYANLEGNILHIDNTNMPTGLPNGVLQMTDSVYAPGARYQGSTTGKHIYASKHLPLGHQSCYIPKKGATQMRVTAMGQASYTAHNHMEERINGFSSRAFRTDINDYMMQVGLPGEHHRRIAAGPHNHMFDVNQPAGNIMSFGMAGGTGNYSDYGGNWGQDGQARNWALNRGYQNWSQDIAEIIVLPCPGTSSAYKTMVDTVESYLATKYGLGADCSSNVIT